MQGHFCIRASLPYSKVFCSTMFYVSPLMLWTWRGLFCSLGAKHNLTIDHWKFKFEKSAVSVFVSGIQSLVLVILVFVVRKQSSEDDMRDFFVSVLGWSWWQENWGCPHSCIRPKPNCWPCFVTHSDFSKLPYCRHIGRTFHQTQFPKCPVLSFLNWIKHLSTSNQQCCHSRHHPYFQTG